MSQKIRLTNNKRIRSNNKQMSNDKVEDNLNPVERVFYSAFIPVCIRASLSENGPALGAQADEGKITEISRLAAFSKFRRAIQTPFNLVFEARR